MWLGRAARDDKWESVCHAGLKACSTLADDGIHLADSLQETDRRSAGIFESLGWGNNLISFSAEGEHDAARAPAPFPHRSLVSAGVFLLGLDLSGHPHRSGALASGDPGRGALSYRRRGHAGLLRA